MRNDPLNRAIADRIGAGIAVGTPLYEVFEDAARRLFVAGEYHPGAANYFEELRSQFEETAESVRDLERELGRAYMTDRAPLPGEDAGCGNFAPDPDLIDLAFGIERDNDQ